jgi:hypothetical protein
MAEKTITLQLVVKCHEKVSEKALERVLNRGINSVRSRTGSIYIDVEGHQCETGFIQWVEAHVQR